MSSESTFVYTPLNLSKAEIRVLVLYPGGQDDELILTFDVVQIQEGSEYDFEAISYRWGSPDGEHQISLDGRSFVITASQHQMIQDLRDTQSVRRIWIDALCINQEDLRERSHQVQLMRRIYSLARVVCIWLDHKIDETSPVFQKFLTFHSVREPDAILKEEDFFWQPICSALKAEYFDRLWVQQEMSNARSIIVQCRTTTLPTACTLNFLNTWADIDFAKAMGTARPNRKDLISVAPCLRFQRILSGYNTTLTESSSPGLLEVLHHSKDLKCTDERDIIYGIMWLAQDWQEGDLVVDYTKTVSEVFTETMISYLNAYNSIAFLEHANRTYHRSEGSKDESPSWAPDWRKSCHCGNSSLKGIGPRKKGKQPVAQISGNFLYSTGIKITTVLHVYPDLLGRKSTSARLTPVPARTFFETFNLIITESEFPRGRENRFVHLLSLIIESALSADFEREGTIDSIAKLFQVVSDLVLHKSKSNPFADPRLDLLGLRFTLLEEMHDAPESFKSNIHLIWTKIAMAQLTGLQPFVSHHGGIGLAPPSTEVGDELWLIPTCRNPIVLRPCEGKYLVLGKACLGKEDPWVIVEQMRECLIEGEEIDGFKVEGICLQ